MAKKVNQPVMVFPNLHASAETLSALLTRFNLYGSYVYEQSNREIEKIIILAGVKVSELKMENVDGYKYLEIHRICDPSRNVLKFAFMSQKILKQFSIQPRPLISSDLYFGFLSSLLITFFLQSPIPIQVSVHGTLLRNKDSAVKAFIRKTYTARVLHLAASIRIVSKELELQLLSQFDISLQKIFIAPIPIDFPEISNEDKMKIIAFVGRFHEERGVEEWVDIICCLHERRKDFSVFMVGDGPLRLYAKSRFESDVPALPLIDFGYLTKPELDKIWPQIKIFLSSAKSEGYGLSLREAVISSAFVVARSSSGSEVLRRELPNLVFTYSDTNEAISHLERLLDSHFPVAESEEFRNRMVEQNQETLGAIAMNWIG